MKYLGIDYGTKFTGLALSDDSGSMAFPYGVLETNDLSKEFIVRLIDENKVKAIVIGWSKANSGIDNNVHRQAEKWLQKLEINLPIFWQDERFTSLEASRHLFDNRNVTRKRSSQKNSGLDRNDDSAATLILQRFLETNK